MKKAKYDHKNCDKEFAKYEVEKVKDKYAKLLEEETDERKKEELLLKQKEEVRLAKKARITANIQMIFQDPIASLDPRMTVHDIIAEGLIIRGERDKEKIDNEVYRVLELVGLVKEHASRYPHEFSGGQRQRIGIARAVILNPQLIIADEPVSALDVSIQAQVINLLNELRDKMGLTTLFIAHDLSVVKYLSDRIAVMYFGKIVELASSDELFAHPLHPYTKSLLSAIPLPDPHFEKLRKRVTYNPLAAHDYSKEGPTMREVCKGHFVYCNSEEEANYLKEINGK
ncbi:MAG: ATP-binding cassette domain-containing protein [Bacillales bacterium]|nr:ATP-binding cassette domain-containing protein [Bacillales bacterium]